jgi:hypothetical protein
VSSDTYVLEKKFLLCCAQSGVTAVTESRCGIGDTAVVNRVRGAGKKVPLEPGDTR